MVFRKPTSSPQKLRREVKWREDSACAGDFLDNSGLRRTTFCQLLRPHSLPIGPTLKQGGSQRKSPLLGRAPKGLPSEERFQSSSTQFELALTWPQINSVYATFPGPLLGLV